MWTLLDLAGSVALLLWGLHMVQTGIQRGFGPDLRRVLGTALGNRLAAFAAGLGVTAILQSSTATGLMVAGFAAGGAVALVPALAVMLGANVGTTLIVQVLSFNVAEVAPALILLGVILFRRGTAARTRDLGRVAIGLGLMLMALHSLVTLVTPYEDVPSLRLVLGAITTEPVLDVLVAAGLTWAAHSSVAVVLLVMSFAAKGAVPPDAAFALVLGANLGTAINPVLEGVSRRRSGGAPAADRQPAEPRAGLRGGAGAAARIGPLMVQFEPDPARAVADFHTGFNLILAALFLPALGPYAWAAAQAAAGAGRRGRSVAAALSGPDGAGIAADRAGRRGARGAAHGGRAGGDAGRRGRGAGEHRPSAHRRGAAAGRRARPAEHRDQGLSDRAGSRGPVRGRPSAPVAGPGVRHQPGSGRRRGGPRRDGTRWRSA